MLFFAGAKVGIFCETTKLFPVFFYKNTKIVTFYVLMLIVRYLLRTFVAKVLIIAVKSLSLHNVLRIISIYDGQYQDNKRYVGCPGGIHC